MEKHVVEDASERIGGVVAPGGVLDGLRDRDPEASGRVRWSHDDVAQNGDAILERLRSGTMPCDGAWPDEQVAVFADWIEAGTPA